MTPKTFYLGFCLAFAFTIARSQQKPVSIIEYDFFSQKADTLANVSFDSSLLYANTDYYIGADSLIDTLEMSLPTVNTFPKSQFTLPKPNIVKYNSSAFPARTAVKIFGYANDSLLGNCSGTMVSAKHVLTGSPCFKSLFTDSVFVDSLLACPGYDEGSENPRFGCSVVQKAYFPAKNNQFQLWGLLELGDSIGAKTGWVSYGFTEVDQVLTNGIYYKFSYPYGKIYPDTITYSEDTLYYAFGEVKEVSPYSKAPSFGVTSGKGQRGEGGSSLLKVNNFQEYTAYGVTTFSNQILQSRLKNWSYFSIKSIIEDTSIVTGVENHELESSEFLIYPNPATNTLNFQLSASNAKGVNYQIYHINGKLLSAGRVHQGHNKLNIDSYEQGLYIIQISIADRTLIKKFIKN